MAKTIIGRNLPLYKGEYSSATVYDRFDVVLYDGSSYVSKLPNNQNKPVTNTTYWQLLAQRGEFTEQQLEEFKAAVVAESKEEMDDYTDDKKDELNTYTNTKETELNAYATVLKNTFDTNASTKTSDFNDNATAKTTAFNTNASDKTDTFDTNVSTKTTAFNDNATSKTTAFNTNATNKTTDFNDNATAKTTAFDTNATNKTNAFDSNASDKTDDFNDNATAKTTAFDNNATAKTEAFDEHTEEIQADIEDLQNEVEELSANMPWTTTEQATDIQVTDAAKYSKNKLELFGNTSQINTTGKNLFNVSNSTIEWNTLVFKVINNIISIFIEDGAGGLAQGSQGQYTNYNFDTTKDYYFSVYHKKGNLLFKENASNKWFRVYIYIKYDDNTTSSDYISITTNMTQKSTKINFTEGKTPVSFAIGRYSLNNTLESSQEAEYYIQLEEVERGSEPTDYEPYTNLQSTPSQDYPQPINIVTGENKIIINLDNIYVHSYRTGYLDATGLYKADSGYRTIFAHVEPNTTYYIQKPETSRCIIGCSTSTLNNNTRTSNVYRDDTATELEYTTDSTANYINIYCYGTNEDITFEELQAKLIISKDPIQDYSINLGSLELCKIGNYSDYLYKENGNWYKHGVINKYSYDGTKAFDLLNNCFQIRNLYPADIGNIDGALITQYKFNPAHSGITSNLVNNEFGFNTEKKFTIKDTRFSSANDFMSHITENPIELWYVSNSPTITQITDETLIAQLDAIYEHLQLVKGTNNITVTTSDLAPYMKLTYMQDLPTKLNNLASRIELLEE